MKACVLFLPRLSLSFLLSVGSAVLLILSFPRFDLWLLAWGSLIPLMIALDGKSPRACFRIAYICGLLFFGVMLFWLGFVTRLGTVLFVLYLALYPGLFGLGYYYCSRTPGLKPFILIPALWVSLEYLRAHVLTGFGWLSLGHTQAANLWLVQIADIGGVAGISFLVVMANVVGKEIFRCIQARVKPGFSLSAGTIILALLLMSSCAYGLWQLHREVQGPSLRVGLAQGNISHEKRWHPRAWPFILEEYLALSRTLADQGAELIVWPESAYPGYHWEDPVSFHRFQEAVAELKTEHLIGIVTQDEKGFFNAAFLLDRQGQIRQRYDKLRLVPFGEFIPLRRQLPFLSAIVPIDDFTPGKDFVLFPAEGKQKESQGLYAVLICFEDTLPEVARAFVRRGAQLLINISNDAWFGDTREPFLHWQNAVFRSIENRRYLVRCGNVGISGVVDPWGRVRDVAQDESGKLTYVPLASLAQVKFLELPTLYTKFGDWFAYFCISVILIYIGIGVVKRRRT